MTKAYICPQSKVIQCQKTSIFLLHFCHRHHGFSTLASVSSMQLASKATALREMTQNKGHYALQRNNVLCHVHYNPSVLEADV